MTRKDSRVLCIVYISTATTSLADADLAGLLARARDTNSGRGITGLLAYRDGRFLQLIEGPQEQVQERFDVITGDPRHRDVIVLERTETDERWFPDWSMAFEPIDDAAVAGVPGFSVFLTEATPTNASSRTQAILHWFRTHPLAAPRTE